MAATLVGRGVHGVRVAGRELEVGDAGVLVDRERGGPGLSAIVAAIHAALAPRGPERPFGGDHHHVAVPRVDQDLADVLRVDEAHSLPGAAGVAALVDAIAPTHVAPAHVLPRADPDDFRVARVERDHADRVTRLVVEDGREDHARVRGLPETARARSDIPGAPVRRVHGEVGDASAHERGADAAEGQRVRRLGEIGSPLRGEHRAARGAEHQQDGGSHESVVSHGRVELEMIRRSALPCALQLPEERRHVLEHDDPRGGVLAHHGKGAAVGRDVVVRVRR